MTLADGHRIVNRIIDEVAGTIATNGIQELPREERGGVSTFGYVRSCLICTAYNAARAFPGFNYSYSEFSNHVETVVAALLRPEVSR